MDADADDPAGPALIDRDTYARVQALRRSREVARPGSSRGGRGRNSPFLLTGVIRCAACGHVSHGYTVRKGKVKKNGERVKTLYYCCGGAISKGQSVCRRVPAPRAAVDEFVLREIGVRVTRFLGDGGRAVLRDHVRRLLASGPSDPRPEMARLRVRAKEIDVRADELVEMMNPGNREFVERKLAKLRRERHAAEARLEALTVMDYRPPDVEGTVEAVLDELRDFRRVIAEGTMEEKKAFVRAFVPGITLDPRDQSAVIRMRRFPQRTGISGWISFRGAGQKFAPLPGDIAEIDELLRVLFEPERLPGAGVWASVRSGSEPKRTAPAISTGESPAACAPSAHPLATRRSTHRPRPACHGCPAHSRPGNARPTGSPGPGRSTQVGPPQN